MTTTRKGDPRARRAHRAVAALFAVHGAVTGTFGTRIPWIQEHAGLSAGSLGFTLIFAAIGASVTMPLAARVVHRLGVRTAPRALLTVFCAMLALTTVAPDQLWLSLTMFVFGAGAGM